jgi:hypothetical protein
LSGFAWLGCSGTEERCDGVNIALAASIIFLAEASASSAASLARFSLLLFLASFSFIPRLLKFFSSAAMASMLSAPGGITVAPVSLSTIGEGTWSSKGLPSSSAFCFAAL